MIEELENILGWSTNHCAVVCEHNRSLLPRHRISHAHGRDLCPRLGHHKLIVVEDHIHALVNLSRKFAIMNVIQEMKTETSKWLKTKSRDTADFAWQSGYGTFSVSE